MRSRRALLAFVVSVGVLALGSVASGGGGQWHVVKSIDPGFYGQPDCVDAKHCFVPDAHHAVLRSVGGTRSWKRAQTRSGLVPQAVSCVGARSCWAAVGFRSRPGIGIVATTNGGGSWH